jgi:hypothetical protein
MQCEGRKEGRKEGRNLKMIDSSQKNTLLQEEEAGEKNLR